MAVIHYAVCGRNVWKLGSTLNYNQYIASAVYFNVFLHGNVLQCYFEIQNTKNIC